ncbi:uncharacterized protein BX664DRAFT_332596 [Halteromyces radiatus]|uniref:uncharacterized protein n=1 Tax=Halteromyces radiatus TaxID=101107 RepID=UPI00221F1C88|nr:uncharacterized protein BX664DRAFT_332596 [Halteromyces radiatus]KAI8089269.1 hypothetical protein BX664DRAFT_332596 [Halteromyces radiatus]
MPSITMKSNTQPKTLKWAIQRVPNKKSSGRIQKRMTSSHSCKSNPAKPPKSEMERLESELAFTLDSLATLSVHFQSLQSAYISSQADLKEQYCPTRLGPKEKELLAAYDDLGLQVVHMERKIKKLETRLQQLAQEEEEKKHENNESSSPISSSSLSTSSFASPCTESAFDMDHHEENFPWTPSMPTDHLCFPDEMVYPMMTYMDDCFYGVNTPSLYV